MLTDRRHFNNNRLKPSRPNPTSRIRPFARWQTPSGRRSGRGVQAWRFELAGAKRADGAGPSPVPAARRGRNLLLGALVVATLTGVCARAVIFYATDDPAHNTRAPTGELADSGWQYQGSWMGFLGTAIAPNYFITASHIGGNIGDPFTFRGVTYTTTAVFDDPNSDLRIWRVCGTFPAFAPLYSKRNERGQPVVVFGRGTRRGERVEVGGVPGAALKGWKWGAADGVQRWGRNVVAAIVAEDGLEGMTGDTTRGNLLKLTFDPDGGPDECHLSGGDSGGGVFIRDGAEWRLAGINFGVDGPYNTAASGAGFQATIFDEGGLYQEEAGQWMLTPDLPTPQPGAFYATRIASNLAWIESVLNSPPPPDTAPVLQAASLVAGPYADDPTAVLDPTQNAITRLRPAQTQFFRVRSCGGVRIVRVRVEGDHLVLTYE